MLITQLKDKEVIASLAKGKVFLLCCHGCKEVSFPEHEVEALSKELELTGKKVNPEDFRQIRTLQDVVAAVSKLVNG